MKFKFLVSIGLIITLATCLFAPLSFAQGTAQTLTLKPGFNFVSFTTAITLTPAGFKELNPTLIEDIYLFSASAGGFLSLSDGTLTSLSAGKGYIVKSSSASNISLNLNGSALPSFNNISLKTGFNLIGFSKIPAATVKFSELMNSYPVIKGLYKWSASAGSFIQVVRNNGVPALIDGTDPEFKAGESYFINVSSDTYINYDATTILMDASTVINTSLSISGSLSETIAAASIGNAPDFAANYGSDFEISVIDATSGAEIPGSSVTIAGQNYTATIPLNETVSYNAIIAIINKTSKKIVYSAAIGCTPLKSAAANIEKISVTDVNITSESSALATLAKDKKISLPAIAAKDSISTMAADTKTAIVNVVGENVVSELKKALLTFHAVVKNGAISSEIKSSLYAKIGISVKETLNAFVETVKLSQSAAIISGTPGAASTITINGTAINNTASATDIEGASSNIKQIVPPADIKINTGIEKSSLPLPATVGIKDSDAGAINYNSVTWQSESTPAYNKDVAGIYIFTGSVSGTSLSVYVKIIVSANVEAPIISPAACYFTTSKQIIITCATAGAIIRYTLDGSIPSSSSPQYSGPITITQTTSVKAIAIKQGLTDSNVVSAKYEKESISGMISFISYRDSGIGEVYTVNADGTSLTRLVETDNHTGSPSISPDGSKIVFSASQANTGTLYGGTRLNEMNSDGTNVKQIYYVDNTNAVNPSYSSDGSKIVFVRNINSAESRIAIMNSDGSGCTDLYTMTPIGNGNIKYPEISPNGSQIVFSYENSWSSEYKLYVMNIDGSGLKLIAEYASLPHFTAEGKIVYYESGKTSSRGIIRCNADGSGAEVLVSSAVLCGSNPAYSSCGAAFDLSPDSKFIAFTRTGEICIVKLDSTASPWQITGTAGAGSLCWGAGQSHFNGRSPVELKIYSYIGTLHSNPTEFVNSIEKVIYDTIYPLINIKAVSIFDNNVLIEHTYKKMSQWIDPVWTIISGPGQITGDIYKYFTASSTPGSATILKATYTESGKEISTQFTINTIDFAASGNLYFSSGKDGYYEIYRSDYKALNVTKLTGHKAYSHTPAVSPDGTKIAYVSGSSSLEYSDREIYVMNSDGTGNIRITNNSLTNYSPSFSPDGKTICYGEDGKIKIINADGTGVARYVTNGSNISDGNPLFTPDGTRIIFSSSHQEGNWYIPDGNFSINIDGSDRKQISATQYENPTITPGGKIAFIRSGSLYTVNLDGSNALEIVNNIGSSSTAFSQDGKWIAYQKITNGVADLYALPATGGDSIRITYANRDIMHDGKIAWGK